MTATLRSTDGERSIAVDAAYVVGADGAHSRTRAAAGIGLVESRPLARHYNLVVRIPGLREALGADPTRMNLIWAPDRHSISHTIGDDVEVWRHLIGPFPVDHELSDAEAADLMRRFVGVGPGSGLEVEILQTSSFPIQERIAERYASGRVVLAGDAAHLFPPYMGQNMNTGIGDVTNLGWKLAALLQGWGSDALLPSYSAERRAIAKRTAASSVAAWRTMLEGQAIVRDEGMPPAGSTDAQRRRLADRLSAVTAIEWNTEGVLLDQRHEGSPIDVDDDAPAIDWEHTAYRAQAKPGHRLPHARRGDGRSVYDGMGARFVLLDLAADPEAVRRAVRGAADAGVPLTVAEAHEPALRELYEADLVLVRPDLHVAWRGARVPERVWEVVRGAG